MFPEVAPNNLRTSPQTSSLHKKKVHFATTLSLVRNVEKYEARDTWLSVADYEVLRADVRLIVAAVKRQKVFMESVTDIFRLADRVASKVLSETTLFEVLVSVPVGHNLSVWCNDYSFRGLEKHIRDKRVCFPLNYQREIILMQRKSSCAEDIRNISLKLTRCDRIVARMLGQGDASARKASLTSSKDCELTQQYPRTKPIRDVKQRQMTPQQA